MKSLFAKFLCKGRRPVCMRSNVPYRLFVVSALIPQSSLCSGISAFPVPVPPPFLLPWPYFLPLPPCVLFPLRVFLVFLLRVLCPGAPVFLTPVPSTLCRFVALPSFASVRSVSLVRLPCFSLRVPAVSARPPFLFFPPSISPPPFPPLPSSFRCFPSPFLLSFPLLRFPLRKSFPLNHG